MCFQNGYIGEGGERTTSDLQPDLPVQYDYVAY